MRRKDREKGECACKRHTLDWAEVSVDRVYQELLLANRGIAEYVLPHQLVEIASSVGGGVARPRGAEVADGESRGAIAENVAADLRIYTEKENGDEGAYD